MRQKLFRNAPIGLAVCAVALASCSRSALVVSEGKTTPRPAPDLEQVPAERDPPLGGDFIRYAIRGPFSYIFVPPKAFRDWFGHKIEAYNPTAEDNVVDSDWFTHRNSRRRMTPEEVARGPIDGKEPDTSGIWTAGRKLGGITPGFLIRDATGARYIIKFDPPGNHELMTSAEAISQRLFHAAGYNTPATYVTAFDPSKARAAEGLTFTDERGRATPATTEDLQELLRRMPQSPDGRIRAVASQFLKGQDLGPFPYEGRRKDDPADTIPHQHRRELRGLYVMAAWLNHLDTKQGNSLDFLVEENGRRFVKHYLIDFGSTLGSASIHPNGPRDGVEHDVDLGNIGARLFSGGLYAARWERYDYDGPEYPSVGFYSTDLFEPNRWRNNYPNPAFQNRTVRDGYWGAKLVASFDEEQIRAAVAEGKLSDPAASEAVVQALLGRREITVRYWYSRVTPLEDLAITGAAAGPARVAVSAAGPALTFTDLAVAEGLVPAPGRRYEMRFEFPAAGIKLQDVVKPSISAEGHGELALPTPSEAGPDFWNRLQSRPVTERLAKLELRAIPGPGQPKPRSVRIYLYPDQNRGYRVVGRAY